MKQTPHAHLICYESSLVTETREQVQYSDSSLEAKRVVQPITKPIILAVLWVKITLCLDQNSLAGLGGESFSCTFANPGAIALQAQNCSQNYDPYAKQANICQGRGKHLEYE